MKSRSEFYNYILENIDQQDTTYSLLLALQHKYYRLSIHSLNVAYSSYYLARKLDFSNLLDRRDVNTHSTTSYYALPRSYRLGYTQQF